jgi:hypothetical protein
MQSVPSSVGNDFSINSISSGASGGSGIDQTSSFVARRNNSEWQKVRHKQQRHSHIRTFSTNLHQVHKPALRSL